MQSISTASYKPMEKLCFTTIGRGHGAPCLPATREDWERMRREPWLKEMCERIEKGEEELKHKLPVWTPSCAEFKDNHRAIADALKPLPRLMMDFDEKGHTDEIVKSLTVDHSPLTVDHSPLTVDHSPLTVLLIEESVRRGTHVLVELPEGMTAEKAQRLMAEATGFEPDKAVKDVARCIYMVPEGYTRYINERLWTTPLQLPRGGESGGAEQKASPRGGLVGVSPRTLFIFDACMKEAELSPEMLIVKGHRHEALKSILSVGATQLMKKEELMGVLQVRMPDNWQDKNIQTLVNDFYAKYHDESQKMTAFQRKVLARSLTPLCLPRGGESEASPRGGLEGVVMPKRLPPLIKLLTSRTPDIYKPAVAHAVFPSLAAHLWKVRFRYIDNVEHEATLMNVLMAGTGAGKDCITEPINHIMADIRRRDDENLEREKEWKKQVNSKGANKDKAQRPEGLIIQEIDADVTNAAFVQRMAEADEHFLYVMLNEIEQFDALKGNGRGGQQFQIMCLAFDHNHRYGQTRVGVQSVTEKVTIRFNWNASTTIEGGQQYFRHVLNRGPISRINFCTIPEREIGADIPVYGIYDAEFDEQLRPYIERLTAARGLIDCPQAFRLAKKLKDECAEFSRLSQSRTYENLSFRALVIAYLKACVLYVAHGNKWDKTMEDFVRWSLHYDLWCKMQFFGEAIERANSVQLESRHRGPRNLLELLPDEFTLEDAVRVRREQGIGSKGVQDMIRTWRNRGFIEERTNEQLNSYIKLKYKKDGTDIK